jgi:hypothetical protein
MLNYFLPYQQDWILDKSPIRVWEKSRRIGATYVQSYEDVRDCVMEYLPKSAPNVWFAAQTEENAREYIRYCQQYAQLFNLLKISIGLEAVQYTENEYQFDPEEWKIINEKRGIKAFSLDFKNGYSIHVLSSSPIRFRGTGGKIVLDEFAFHKNPQELWETITPCTMWGGRICILSTHSEPDSFYHNLIKNIKKGEYNYSVHSVTINDAIDQGLVEKINKETNQNITKEQFTATEQNKCKIAHEGDDWESHWAREYLCDPRKNTRLLAIRGFSNENLANVEYKPIIYTSDSMGNIKQTENPVYLFCDFNWSQNSWGLGHIYNGEFFMFKEYCKEMYTEDLIALVLNEFNHNGLIIINGDASGKKNTSNSKKTDYRIIENALVKAGYPKENDYYKSGKRYRRRTNNFNIDRSDSFYMINSKIKGIDEEPHFYVNPATCPIFVYACENLKLKPGTSEYKGYSEKELENNSKLKFMDDIIDAARYWVGANCKHPKNIIQVPDKLLMPLEQWNRQNKYKLSK